MNKIERFCLPFSFCEDIQKFESRMSGHANLAIGIPPISKYCCWISKQTKVLSLLQLGANLIEGEPYNPLALKNKRLLNVA